jgi:hypothetical protein
MSILECETKVARGWNFRHALWQRSGGFQLHTKESWAKDVLLGFMHKQKRRRLVFKHANSTSLGGEDGCRECISRNS